MSHGCMAYAKESNVTTNAQDTVEDLKQAACKAWDVSEDDYKLEDWFKGAKHCDLGQ